MNEYSNCRFVSYFLKNAIESEPKKIEYLRYEEKKDGKRKPWKFKIFKLPPPAGEFGMSEVTAKVTPGHKARHTSPPPRRFLGYSKNFRDFIKKSLVDRGFGIPAAPACNIKNHLVSLRKMEFVRLLFEKHFISNRLNPPE